MENYRDKKTDEMCRSFIIYLETILNFHIGENLNNYKKLTSKYQNQNLEIFKKINGRYQNREEYVSFRSRVSGRLVTQGERTKDNCQQATPDHRAEHPAPAPVIGNPAHPAAGDGRAEHIPKEPRESRRCARRLLRHKLECVQADNHDRAIDKEPDDDECGAVDPQRPVAV